MSKKKESTLLNPDCGVVLYVDGGCRPGYSNQPDDKNGGWGIHGYGYHIGNIPKTKMTKKDATTLYGYLPGDTVDHEKQITPKEYIDAYGSMTNRDTSDRAELRGFSEALKIIKEKGYKQAHLLLDNQYVIHGATGGYEKWSSHNWMRKDGTERPNKHIWEDIMQAFIPLKGEVKFNIQWVNGHSGNLGNDRADYLATKGVYLGRNGFHNVSSIKYSPVAKYRNPEVVLNRLFCKTRWYFNTEDENPIMSNDGRYVYHVGAHGDDDTLVGKPMADSSAAVIYTKEKQSVLEDVRLRHRELIDNPLNHLCMARLDTLLLPRIYEEIEQDGINVLSIAPRKLRFKGLCTIDEQEVTRIIEPSGLTFKLIQVHNHLQNELDNFLKGQGCITDVTHHFYKHEEGKKGKIDCKTIIEPTMKKLELIAKLDNNPHVKEHLCRFTFGIDCPPKECFKALESRDPKVYIMTFHVSEFAFRYAMIIDIPETDGGQGDTMLWMGKDSSLQLVYPKKK